MPAIMLHVTSTLVTAVVALALVLAIVTLDAHHIGLVRVIQHSLKFKCA